MKNATLSGSRFAFILRLARAPALGIKMLPPEEDLENRRPIWIACSALFLDTELQEYNYKSIARTCAESPYSWDELDAIMLNELWPVFRWNLYSVAGEWSGWPSEFIESEVLKARKTWWRLPARFSPLYKSFRKDWEKVRHLIED